MLKSPPTQNRVDFTLPLFYLLPTTKREDTQSFLTQKREFVTIKRGNCPTHTKTFLFVVVFFFVVVFILSSHLGPHYFIFGRVHPILSPVTYYFILVVFILSSHLGLIFLFLFLLCGPLCFLFSLLTLAPFSRAIYGSDSRGIEMWFRKKQKGRTSFFVSPETRHGVLGG